MTHRLLSCDCGDGEGVSCYRCGAHAESSDALGSWNCTGPSTEHPPYLLAGGTVETCASHPYSGCDPVRARCGRVDPHGAHAYVITGDDTGWTDRREWCAGNVNIVRALI